MKKNLVTVITVVAMFFGFSANAQNVKTIEVCYGKSITLTATPTNGGINPTYQWILNDENIENANSSTYSYTPEDGDLIWCEVTSSEDCAEPETAISSKVSVIVNPLPILLQPDNIAVCNDGTVNTINFSGTYVDPNSVTWVVTDDLGTGIGMSANSGTGSIPSFTAINTTLDPVTVTITVTPVSAAGCIGTEETFTITVNPSLVPSFEFELELEYCQNDTPVALPEISTNGVHGTWSPAVISTENAGVVTYTFTPNPGECVVGDGKIEVVVTVNENLTPTFDFELQLVYCQNAQPELLPNESTNGVKGTWSPAVISTETPGTEKYTFTPDEGECVINDGVIEVEVTVNETLELSVEIEVTVN